MQKEVTDGSTRSPILGARARNEQKPMTRPIATRETIQTNAIVKQLRTSSHFFVRTSRNGIMDFEEDIGDPFATGDLWRESQFAFVPFEPLPPMLKEETETDLMRELGSTHS